MTAELDEILVDRVDALGPNRVVVGPIAQAVAQLLVAAWWYRSARVVTVWVSKNQPSIRSNAAAMSLTAVCPSRRVSDAMFAWVPSKIAQHS